MPLPTVLVDAGIEPRTVATSALTMRSANHSARSHPRRFTYLSTLLSGYNSGYIRENSAINVKAESINYLIRKGHVHFWLAIPNLLLIY